MPIHRRSSLPRRARLLAGVLAAVAACALTISLLVLTGHAFQQQAPPAPDLKRELALSTADGFTLAAVGDCIIARPVSQAGDEPFKASAKILHDADVTFGNFEGSAFDIRRFRGYPQAEFGGIWLIGVPEVAKDLRSLGFDLMSRANNHTTDWGIEGMRETDRALDEVGIVHAGSGENRGQARAARYLDTPKGRVGLVSMASSFTPMSRSMPPVGEAPGRPGLNALRTTRFAIVTPEMMQVLRKIRDAQPAGSVRPDPDEPKDEFELLGVRYKVGDKPGFAFKREPVDEREILKAIRHGKENSDFMIATIHAHEPGNWSDQPADFLPEFARAAIDNGADEFIGHGPHQLRAIEIYKGKPIFYSLGNYMFELNLQEPVAADLFEQFKVDPNTQTDAEFGELWRARGFKGEVWYQSVVAVSRFEQGQVAAIRLYPVDLGAEKRSADRGVPRLAAPAVAQAILERLQRLSKPYGTMIAIEQSVGVIRLRPPTTSQAEK